MKPELSENDELKSMMNELNINSHRYGSNSVADTTTTVPPTFPAHSMGYVSNSVADTTTTVPPTFPAHSMGNPVIDLTKDEPQLPSYAQQSAQPSLVATPQHFQSHVPSFTQALPTQQHVQQYGQYHVHPAQSFHPYPTAASPFVTPARSRSAFSMRQPQEVLPPQPPMQSLAQYQSQQIRHHPFNMYPQQAPAAAPTV
eukprot:24861_1